MINNIKLQIIGVKSTLDFSLCITTLSSHIGFPHEDAVNIVCAAKAKQRQTIEFPCEMSKKTVVTNLSNLGLIVSKS